MIRSLNKFLVLLLLAVVPATSFALPVDWHGAFGVDSTLISGFRRVKGTTVNPANDGSQEVGLASGNQESASWQSYILKLSPTMIINDAATFKAEMTTGYASGGFLGDSPQTDMGGANTGNNNVPLYYHNQAKGSNVTIKKAYVELYSDTATYVIGRHTYNWGLGAVYNDGANAWDRHSYSRDGLTMKLKIGSFHVNPFWSKVANTGYTRSTNAKEYGIGLLYDNEERDIAFGLIYSVKSSGSFNTTSETTINGGAAQKLGETNVKITDLYLKKKWGNFDVAIEVPLISGDLGKTDGSGNITTYSAKAFVLQSNYKLSEAWKFGVDGGQVAGHDGSTKKFGAIYLNPNYQVANLLFRYNIGAIASPTNTESVYDSYMTNARYLKIRSSYSTEKWTFDSALIYAKAIEKVTAGQVAYNHTKNKNFTANTTQSDDLGTEIDLNATYRWNNEISIGAGVGYLMTGEYFSYTNDANVKNSAEDSLLLQINTAVTF
jgi:hypothetical protein